MMTPKEPSHVMRPVSRGATSRPREVGGVRNDADKSSVRSPGASPIRPPISVKEQNVAGCVVYRHTPDGIKFLLLYRRGNYWNFPKGKLNPGEDNLTAALRETEEETGLKKSELRLRSSFQAHEKFHFYDGNQRIYDTVVLYLAETAQVEVRIVPREHSGFAWFLYTDAQKILGKKYAGTRRVLKKAYDFIRQHRNPAPNRRRFLQKKEA